MCRHPPPASVYAGTLPRVQGTRAGHDPLASLGLHVPDIPTIEKRQGCVKPKLRGLSSPAPLSECTQRGSHHPQRLRL